MRIVAVIASSLLHGHLGKGLNFAAFRRHVWRPYMSEIPNLYIYG